MVIYPIVDDVDGQGNQLVNWVAEIQRARCGHERLEPARRAAQDFIDAVRATGASTGWTCRP